MSGGIVCWLTFLPGGGINHELMGLILLEVLLGQGKFRA